MAHAYAIQEVQVWIRDHDNVVEALNYRETVSKLAIVNKVALTSNSANKFIFLDLTVKQCIYIVDI